MKLTTETWVPGSAKAVRSSILNVEDFPNFINVIRDVKIRPLQSSNDVLVTGAVQIVVKYFSGWVEFKVSAKNEDQLVIQVTKGPFKFAEGILSLNPSSRGTGTDARMDLDCVPLIPVYGQLIQKHKQTAFDLLLNMFSMRSANHA